MKFFPGVDYDDDDDDVAEEPPSVKRRKIRSKQPPEHPRPEWRGNAGPASDRVHRDFEAVGGDRRPRADQRFGPKPEGISQAQWGALQMLHLRLTHPPTSTLVRLLRRWGVQQAIIDSVAHLDCDVCRQVQRPRIARAAAYKRSTEFNENVFIDEFEVTMVDGTRWLLLMILDDASGFRTVVPSTATASISGRETRALFDRAWGTWAGYPDVLHYDSHSGHLSEGFQTMGTDHAILMRPIPAEATELNGPR